MKVFAQHAGETLLVTFGVPVPAKTEPAKFFDFLQQQGYLRVWIDGETHRTDEAPKVTRLPAVVRVIQDRMKISPKQNRGSPKRSRSRCVSARGRSPSSRARPSIPSPPAGIARIATSTSRRRRRDCSASTIRSARARNAAASGAPSRSTCSARFPIGAGASSTAW